MSQSSWNQDRMGQPPRKSWFLVNEPQHFVLLFVLLAGLIGSMWYAFRYEKEPIIITSKKVVIRADPGPFRIRPDNYGKIEIQHQDKEIYASLGRGTQPPENFQSRPNAQEETPLVIAAPKTPAEQGVPGTVVQPSAPQTNATPVVQNANNPAQPPANHVTVASPSADKLIQKAAINPPKRKDLAKQGENWVRLAMVQDYDSALKEWARIQKIFKDVFAGKEAAVAAIDLESGGRLYPIYIGPYSTPEEAQKACAQIKTKVGCLTEKLLP